ncbi:MAG: hypothetical protein ABWZ53_07305 [Actinomycetota bacterium]
MPDSREPDRRRRAIVTVVVTATALVLVGTFAVGSASVEIRGIRAASSEHAVATSEPAPPSPLALDKMTEALLWAWSDDECVDFVRRDIQHMMGCAPVAWLHDEIDPLDPGALDAFGVERRRFTERHDRADGFLIGEAERRGHGHELERLSIAWRCAAS